MVSIEEHKNEKSPFLLPTLIPPPSFQSIPYVEDILHITSTYVHYFK